MDAKDASEEMSEEMDPSAQGKLDINVVCEGALAYMSFPDGESAEQFVTECKAGEHPEVIERYKADMNLGAGATIQVIYIIKHHFTIFGQQWKTLERKAERVEYNRLMTNTYIIKSARYAALGVVTFLLFFIGQLSPVSAATSCDFTRDLEVGVDGEDVRCLQKYLNDAGFQLAETGPGAPGSETTLFRDGTKAAVIKWQTANSVSPASGYFGTLSRAKYAAISDGASSSSGSSSSSVDAQRAEILARIAALQSGGSSSQTTTTTAVSQSVTVKALKNAIAAIREAEEQIEDALDDGLGIGRADDRIVDARDDFYSAIEAYLDGNNQRALSMAENAIDNALDAFEDAGGETEEDEVEDYLDELADDIDDAWDTVEAADDDGDDVRESEELLEEAEDLLDDAEQALDDGDFDEARDIGDDVEDLIDDALDAIGNSRDDEQDAEEAIEDAEDAIDEAEDAIDDAKDDGDDTDDAEDLLDEAQDLLDEAQDAFDDEDYDDAIDLAEEAEDLAQEAIDEL